MWRVPKNKSGYSCIYRCLTTIKGVGIYASCGGDPEREVKELSMGKYKLRGGLSSDAFLLTLVKLVTMVVGFVVTRLLSQYLSIYDYGTYSQALLLVSTVSSLTILGMRDGVNYYYCSRSDSAERERYVATIFASQCVVSTVAGCAVMAMSSLISAYFENPGVKDFLVFCALLPFADNLIGMLQVLLVSVGKAKMLAFRNLIVSFVRLAVVLLVILVLRDVRVVLLTTLLLDALQILFFLLILRENGCAIRLRMVDFRLTKEILAYCVPMAVFVAVNVLNRDLDKHLIAFMTDTQTVAIYANASKYLPFDILPASFCTVLVPPITRSISDKNYLGARSLYKVFLEIAYMTTAMLCGAALAAAPQMVRLLYSEKYMAALDLFRIYILVDLARFASITLILSAAGKTRLLMVLGLTTLGMNGVLNVVFYYLWGINGPAVATLVTTLMMSIVLLCLSARELKGKLRDLFDGKYLLEVGVGSVIAVPLFALLGQWLEAKGMWYFWILMIVCGSYCLLFLLLNVKRLLADLKCLNREAGSV